MHKAHQTKRVDFLSSLKQTSCASTCVQIDRICSNTLTSYSLATKNNIWPLPKSSQKGSVQTLDRCTQSPDTSGCAVRAVKRICSRFRIQHTSGRNERVLAQVMLRMHLIRRHCGHPSTTVCQQVMAHCSICTLRFALSFGTQESKRNLSQPARPVPALAVDAGLSVLS